MSASWYSFMTCRPSLSHWMAAPAMYMPPSKNVLDAISYLPSHGGEQAVAGYDGGIADVHLHKAAGSVCIFDHAFLKNIPARRGLLAGRQPTRRWGSQAPGMHPCPFCRNESCSAQLPQGWISEYSEAIVFRHPTRAC